jgi:hypothetical protein
MLELIKPGFATAVHITPEILINYRLENIVSNSTILHLYPKYSRTESYIEQANAAVTHGHCM